MRLKQPRLEFEPPPEPMPDALSSEGEKNKPEETPEEKPKKKERYPTIQLEPYTCSQCGVPEGEGNCPRCIRIRVQRGELQPK